MPVTQINSQKIKDGTVDTGDLKDSSVTTAKLADSAVTPAKVQIHPSSQGAMMVSSASGVTEVLPPGDDGKVLSADSGGFAGMAWVDRGKVGFASITTSNSAGGDGTGGTTGTAETQLNQLYTIPANSLSAGNVIKATFAGRYTQASGSVTIRVYLQTSVFLDFGSFAPATTGTSRGWSCEVTLIIGTTGTTGTCRGYAKLLFNNIASPIVVTNTDVTINTTVSRDLKLTAQWSVANAGNAVVTNVVDALTF